MILKIRYSLDISFTNLIVKIHYERKIIIYSKINFLILF